MNVRKAKFLDQTGSIDLAVWSEELTHIVHHSSFVLGIVSLKKADSGPLKRADTLYEPLKKADPLYGPLKKADPLYGPLKKADPLNRKSLF